MGITVCILLSSCVSTATNETVFGEIENKRLEKIKNPTRRRESKAGLVALKKALGRRAFCDVVRDEHGKPRFEKNIGIDFNISHSGSLSLAAVCDGEGNRIGVDIELVREERLDSLLRIAERYFDESEKERFCKSKNVLEFYRLWTAKEAHAKLLGVGLSKALGEKKEPSGEIFTSHFLVEHSGEKYILSVSTETDEDEEIEFVFEGDIAVSPFLMEVKNGYKRRSE